MTPKKRAESRARYYVRREAEKRGWKLSHVSKGGDVLEEQEIEDVFPDIGLSGDKPDFLFCRASAPHIVVEAKNEAGKVGQAVAEAIDYAVQINNSGQYAVNLAVGAAGEKDWGFEVVTVYRQNGDWVPLTANGYQLTTFPSTREVELALEANDGSTKVSVPSQGEFIDSAIEVSQVLRSAKIEPPLRPKVIGAIVLAMYQGELSIDPDESLGSINDLCEQAIQETDDISEETKNRLRDALYLSVADFGGLSSYLGRVVNILKRLNIRSVIHTDADFLGMFYEAFLRYGYDSKSLGIVFTPRHITGFCVDLVGAELGDTVIDVACGTGGFLVAALDRMMQTADSAKAKQQVKQSITGIDTNSTVWALSLLNMFFRGDGKSHIYKGDCFDDQLFEPLEGSFDRAFLNPPFSQDEEPERLFIDRSMEALQAGGQLAVVVKAGIFADNEHEEWRGRFVKSHKVRAVISLPEELFYPIAAPTSILVAEAGTPLSDDDDVLMARVWNDGFEKLKGKRVPCDGDQLPEVLDAYHAFRDGNPTDSELVTTICGRDIKNGEEWSPQEWLPQPEVSKEEFQSTKQEVLASIFRGVCAMPSLGDIVLEDFETRRSDLPNFGAYGETAPISKFFTVQMGNSMGMSNYTDGIYPYISSGDPKNSIIGLIHGDEAERFDEGGITVTAFGTAFIQPWPFFGRGNGGSAVRVLLPKFGFTLHELIWFAAQINIQQWRFLYARMAINSRIKRLEVDAPPEPLVDDGKKLHQRIGEFQASLNSLTQL